MLRTRSDTHVNANMFPSKIYKVDLFGKTISLQSNFYFVNYLTGAEYGISSDGILWTQRPASKYSKDLHSTFKKYSYVSYDNTDPNVGASLTFTIDL